MHASSTLFFAAIMALARVALATPPACLIAALGAQSNPSDLKSLCGTLEPQVAGNITEKCSGDAESSAISIFSATCLASESVTISIRTSSASGSSSATTTGSSRATATGSGSKTTGTASAGSASTGSASTGSAPTGTTAGSASETSKTGGSSLTSPRSAIIMAPLVLAAGFAQYLL